MEFEITRGQRKSTLDYSELNDLLGTKVSANFWSMVKRLKIGEKMYHYETKTDIKRIK
jgi:hypothetical protein